MMLYLPLRQNLRGESSSVYGHPASTVNCAISLAITSAAGEQRSLSHGTFHNSELHEKLPGSIFQWYDHKIEVNEW